MEDRKIAPFRPIPPWKPFVVNSRGAVPCSHAGYHKSVVLPIVDPYGLEKWEKNLRAKHPEFYR